MRIPLPARFQAEIGHCYTVLIEEFAAVSDQVASPDRSPVALFEDGRPLGPAHAHHEEIRRRGEGRFSHWSTRLYFSTSDNSDPRSNGRTYELEVDADCLPRDDAQRRVEAGAHQALQIVGGYHHHLGFEPESLRGLEILEVGPGAILGPALLWLGMGARVTVADAMPIGWDADVHPPTYRRVCELMPSFGLGDWPVGGLQAVLAAGSHDVDGLTVLETPAERLDEACALDHFDLIVSSSVLEHVRGLDDAMRAFHRCLKQGAAMFHSVDYRDHLDFGDPKRFLLEEDETYEASLDEVGTARGTRKHHSDVVRSADACGFLLDRFEVSELLGHEYVRGLLAEWDEAPGAHSRDRPDPRDVAVAGATYRWLKR